MFKNFNGMGGSPDGQVVSLARTKPGAASAATPVGNGDGAELNSRLELKRSLHARLLDEMNLAVIDKVRVPELRREVANLVMEYLREKNIAMRSEAISELVDELLNELTGLGPLEPLLADPTVNDILVNSFRNVYVERFGVLEKAEVRFRDEKHLLRIIDKIVSRVGRRVDESQPWVDARLEDGSRVNAIIRPCAIDGPSLSIRKFSRNPLTLQRLVDSGAVTGRAAILLQAFVEARMNVLISGGTGSGKTTMLNAMSAFIDPRQRIVTIEDAAELQLMQDHVVRLETRPSNAEGGGVVSQRDLVKNALRMRPDRIIVGEVRGSEAFDMLQAMNTGHDGSMTTIHANTARDAMGRLEQMVSMVSFDFPLRAIRQQIAAGIQIVIQLSRLSDGCRRVMSISEVTGMEGDVITMQDIFVFRKNGRSAAGEVLGDFVATGIRPECAGLIAAAGVVVPSDLFLDAGAK